MSEATTVNSQPDTGAAMHESSVDWKPLNRDLVEPVKPSQPPSGTKLSQALSSKALAESSKTEGTPAQTSEPSQDAATPEAQDELSEEKQEVKLKEDKSPEEPKEQEDSKAEKKHKRFEKDTDRLVKGWETYNSEKSKLDKDKAEFETFWQRHKPEHDRVVREAQELREKVAVYEKERPDVVKLDPAAYKQLAKQARAEGDYEIEERYITQAEKLENDLKAWNERQERESRDSQERLTHYRNQAAQTYPEIKDPNSALHKKAVEIFNHRGDKVAKLLRSDPEGELFAVQIADLELRADKAEALAKENETLRKKLAELNHKTSLSGSVNQPERKSNLKDLPLDQRGKLLRQRIASRSGVLATS